jgi:hypothetical protein
MRTGSIAASLRASWPALRRTGGSKGQLHATIDLQRRVFAGAMPLGWVQQREGRQKYVTFSHQIITQTEIDRSRYG